MDIFPQELLDLYKQQNEGKPVTYREVQNWYGRYAKQLKNPDGSQAYPDWRKTWTDVLNNRPKEEAGRPSINSNITGGSIPGLGMIDPTRALEGAQAGLDLIRKQL